MGIPFHSHESAAQGGILTRVPYDQDHQNSLSTYGNSELGSPSGLFDADYLTIRHKTAATKTGLGIYPRGSPATFGGILEVGMTDKVNDGINYGVLSIYAGRAISKFIIDSQQGGSVSLYPIGFRMGGTELITLNTDLSIDFNSRLLKNLVAGADVNLGAYKLKTTNWLIRESADNLWLAVKNAADTAYGDFIVKKINVQNAFEFGASGTTLDGRDADNAASVFRARDNGVGQTEVARLQAAATATFDLLRGRLTGTLNCNSQLLKDPKNYADATLSGTPVIVAIDIGGSEYYAKFYPTKT